MPKKLQKNGEHHIAKAATALGATGLLAAAGVAAIAIRRRRHSAEAVQHIQQRRHLRELQTYGPDAQGRQPEESAAVFNSPNLSEAQRDLLAEVAVRIYLATIAPNRGVTFDTLRSKFDAAVDDELLKTAIADLDVNGLISADPPTRAPDKQLAFYEATPALDWAINQSPDYTVLADATIRVIDGGHDSAG